MSGIGPSNAELLGIPCRVCGRGPGPFEHGHRIQELEAERDQLLDGAMAAHSILVNVPANLHTKDPSAAEIHDAKDRIAQALAWLKAGIQSTIKRPLSDEERERAREALGDRRSPDRG